MIRAYFSVFRMRFKMETQYRGAVLGGTLCQMFFGLILIALYRTLFFSRPQGDTSLSRTVTYVWLQQAFFRMILSSDADLTDKIRTGSIAYDLCRPMDLYAFYYLRILAQKLVGSVMRAVPMLALAAVLPGGWGLSAPASPAALAYALVSLLLGMVCVCAFENVSMGITMRTIDGKGVQAMLNLLMTTFCGNILPLTLFPASWQRVMGFLPFSQMLDAPIRLYTGQWAAAELPRALLMQCAWTATLMALGIFIWKKNLRRIVVQGG